MLITAEQREQLLAHARDDEPNECCGWIRLADGRVDEVIRGTNRRASPYGYELDSKTLLNANLADDEGHGVAIYHSHPRSPAEPSQTDINLATYPHWLYVIVSLADDSIRAWRIADGRVEEEPVELA